MNDRWRRVRAILEGALDRTASERAEFVREASAGDVTIEREVLELLAADSAPNTIGGAIAEGVVSQVASGIASAAVLQPGAVVGRYRLVRVVGTGGMGAVWEAEQDDPKRPVALKVLQHAFALPTEVARFRFEAEVLGRLHHPHIAQVYEAGTFGSGQPFFAMEFVENARPLCGFANERGLDVRSKLDLLLAVADAVHHGHQRGVIHRDLKSANVLVDGHGHPKVIDFGIARGIGVEPGATPQLTRTGQMVGTLATMAPEQIEGKSEATDVRTDVYALGVILCELLTGKLPIDFTDVNLLEAARRIQCDPPVLPSAYDPSLPRELDWIAGKALAKEKARRYASASEFAADLRRFLDGEAVVAAPESRLYRARVFARRHRVGLIATVLVVVALASGLGVALQARSEEQIARTRAETSLALAKQARSEEQIARTRAETSLARAKSALAFVTGMLESVRPEEAGRDVRVRDVLLVADQDLQRGFNGPPEVEAAARASLGGSWLALDFTQEAETQLVRALELRERVLGKDDPETIDSLRALERLRARQGRMIETERLAAELTARSERVLGPDHPDTLLAHADHANALTMLGRGTEAESEVRDARARWPATLPPTDPRLIDLEKSLLTVLEYRKAGEEATRVAHDVYERVRSSFGPVHPRTLEAAGAYGRQLIGNGDRDGGLALMRTMLELHKKQLGPEHDHTLYAEESLLSCERYAGNLDTYCKRLEELIAVRERHDGPTYFRTLQDKGLLGIGLSQLGQYPKAIATLTGARDDALASAGADDPVTLQLSTWLAQAKLDSGDVEGAKADLRAALASPAVQADPTGARALALKESLGLTLRDPEHLAEGATLMREVLAARRAALAHRGASGPRFLTPRERASYSAAPTVPGPPIPRGMRSFHR